MIALTHVAFPFCGRPERKLRVRGKGYATCSNDRSMEDYELQASEWLSHMAN